MTIGTRAFAVLAILGAAATAAAKREPQRFALVPISAWLYLDPDTSAQRYRQRPVANEPGGGGPGPELYPVRVLGTQGDWVNVELFWDEREAHCFKSSELSHAFTLRLWARSADLALTTARTVTVTHEDGTRLTARAGAWVHATEGQDGGTKLFDVTVERGDSISRQTATTELPEDAVGRFYEGAPPLPPLRRNKMLSDGAAMEVGGLRLERAGCAPGVKTKRAVGDRSLVEFGGACMSVRAFVETSSLDEATGGCGVGCLCAFLQGDHPIKTGATIFAIDGRAVGTATSEAGFEGQVVTLGARACSLFGEGPHALVLCVEPSDIASKASRHDEPPRRTARWPGPTCSGFDQLWRYRRAVRSTLIRCDTPAAAEELRKRGGDLQTTLSTCEGRQCGTGSNDCGELHSAAAALASTPGCQVPRELATAGHDGGDP